MKKTLLIILVLCFCQVRSQTNCSTTLAANYIQNYPPPPSATTYSVKHDTCLNKKFSIVFYVIPDSSGAWGFTPGKLDTCVRQLDTAFKRICVSFMNCSTVVIPNYQYARWKKNITDPIVTNNWYTTKTINIYLVDTIDINVDGYAYYPGGKDAIVLAKRTLTSTIVPPHEMGHFFGLPHTFNQINPANVTPAPPPGVASREFVSRTNLTNCYTHGDGFCDTEADCYPLGLGTADGTSQFYLRPIDNLMSFYGTACRFTTEQYNFMVRTILRQRLYLH